MNWKKLVLDPLFIFLLACTTVTGVLAEHELDVPFVEQVVEYDASRPTELLSSVDGSEAITANVYYTTDGSLPTLSSDRSDGSHLIKDLQPDASIMYIPTSYRWRRPWGDFPTCKIITGAAYDDGFGSLETRTLETPDHGNLAVVSLILPPEGLFSNDEGIYVIGNAVLDMANYGRDAFSFNIPWWERPGNYRMRGSDWERDAHMTVVDQEGQVLTEEQVAIRMNGNATRSFPLKSIRVYRDEPTLLLGEMAPDRLVLRNSGNDWDRSLFRDGLMQLMAPEEVVEQEFEPCVVYLNGIYWGIHHMRDRIDDGKLASHHQLDTAGITILENEGELKDGSETAVADYKELMNFISNEDHSLESRISRIEAEIDVAVFIDYLCSEIYFCNTDWPNNNVMWWRSETDSSYHRWRWILKDMDYGFGFIGSQAAEKDMFSFLENSRTDIGMLFRTLMQHEDFRVQFEDRMVQLLEGMFSANRATTVIAELSSLLEPEMDRHIRRWRTHDDLDDWRSEVDQLHDFAMIRADAVKLHLFNYLSTE